MELYQIVMVVFGLFQVLITVHAKPAGNNQAVNYGVVHTVPCGGLQPDYHMALRRHVFKTLKVPSSLHCLKACDNDVRCQSINQVMGKGICELNNRTKEARPDDLIIDNTKLYVPRQHKRGERVLKWNEMRLRNKRIKAAVKFKRWSKAIDFLWSSVAPVKNANHTRYLRHLARIQPYDVRVRITDALPIELRGQKGAGRR